MSVEGGGVGGGIAGVGVAVSIGPAVNVTAGSAVSVGPSLPVGIEGRFGPSITGLSSPIVSEGPVGRSFLENTMPVATFNPVGEIKFNNDPFIGNVSSEPLLPQDGARAVEEAVNIISQAQKPLKEEEAVAEAEYWLGIGRAANPTILNTIVEQNVGAQAENKVFAPAVTEGNSRRAQVLGAPSLLMLAAARTLLPVPLEIMSGTVINQVILAKAEPELVRETDTEVKSEPKLVYIQSQTEPDTTEVLQPQKVKEEEIEERVPEAKEEKEEEIAELSLSHTVDRKTAERRIDQIRKAAIKAQAEAESHGKAGQIEGWRILKHLFSPHSRDYRGKELEIVDPRGNLPDGTWEANMEKVGVETFSSENDVAERVPKIIALDPPVAEGSGGGVTDNNMATTYRYDETKIHPAYQVYKRVTEIRRRQTDNGQSVASRTQVKKETEGQIIDYPALAEALRAA